MTSWAEDMVSGNNIESKEMFIVTDKEISENTYYKGHSVLPKLNSVTFLLHKLEQETGTIFASSTLPGLG